MDLAPLKSTRISIITLIYLMSKNLIKNNINFLVFLLQYTLMLEHFF